MMRTCRTLIASGLLAATCGLCASATAAPQTGWYWNPNESGRGFFVESRDAITFIGAYLYDTDGHALWLVAGGENDDAYNYSGPLYSQSGGQALFGTYVAPASPVSIGNITVHFSDDTHASITWPGGSVQVERQIFGTGAPAFLPQAGWWWNPDESGTGYSLEVQGTNLFVVGFMYENSGRPVWYFAAGPMSSDTTFHGDVVQFAGGQTMGGPYHPPGAPAAIGTLDIAFTDVDEATFTFSDSAPVARSAQFKRKENKFEQKQFPQPPLAYSGRMQAYSSLSSGGTARWDINVDSMSFVDDPSLGPLLGRGNVYALKSTTMRLTYVSDLAGCTAQAAATVPITDSAFLLQVLTNRTYSFQLNLPGFVVQGTLTCSGETTPFTVVFPGLQSGTPGATIAVENQTLSNHHSSWEIARAWSTGSGAVTAGGSWDFAPVWR